MPTRSDAVPLLERDHRELEALFQAFERSEDPAQRKALSARITRELSIHASIEEQFLYPLARRIDDGSSLEPRVLEALEEHHLARLVLSELARLPAGDPRLEAKVRVLAASVRRHVAAEERELLPAMTRAYTPAELRELGAALERARRIAPTRPHPGAPDEPPGAMFAGLAAGAWDRSRDGLALLVERAGELLRQLAGAALHRGEEAVRQARERLGRGLAGAREELLPAAVERRVRRGVRAARRAGRRVEQALEEAASQARPPSIH